LGYTSEFLILLEPFMKKPTKKYVFCTMRFKCRTVLGEM